ncbi:MAG: endonuclease/exonuclease/phosphatase family protein [Acidimicrobiales bacterium]|nr:endonuclease/exonuclease/phosphatase family protein [Acidimicrobiales bacterium]
MLQEVKGGVAKAVRAAHPGTCVFSQEVFEEATWGWMGCGVLLRRGAEILDCGVVGGLPKPQRSLWARVRRPDGQEVTAVSWHTPNAAGDGVAVKMAAYSSMSEWLASAPRPLVLGADLNTWRDPIDLIDPDPSDDFFEEHAFIGPTPSHGLVDAYRTVLEAGGELDRRRAEKHEGPLAVSHTLSSGASHRMDRIFSSPDLRPSAGGYEYAGAIEAGSDHALHWIDFS